MSQTLNRRSFLAAAATGAVAPVVLSGRAVAQTPAPTNPLNTLISDGQRFDPGLLTEAARLLARRPLNPISVSDLPDGYAGMPYDVYVGIRAQPGAVIWSGENRGFTIEPLHRGYVFNTPVSLFLIEDGLIRRVGYDRGKFDFGRVPPPPGNADLQFSGFRVATGLERPYETAIFQGATFYRMVARGQNFGAISRALILRPGETRGEEIPFFRAFWIERPNPASGLLVIHAILDSDSLTGAVRMTLRPGDVAFVDVEMTLFTRQVLDHVGYGCTMGSFLTSPQSRRTFDDIRPAVHEISGVQMQTGGGEWIYRPVSNPATLQVSAFVDTNPRGFGLVQRERDATAYQDDDQRFEMRPSVWVQPLGEWGAGSVQLLEIPSDNEINDNIISYWRPRLPVSAGAEIEVSFRQAWCWQPPERPPLATVQRVRQGRGGAARRRRFFVDFAGERLGDSALVAALRATVTSSPGTIQSVRLWPYPERRTLRVGFELDPGNDAVCELRLVLDAGGQPISETWLNRWTS